MWSLSWRIFWLALVVKLVLMIQTIESFISPPTDMVLFGRLMHLKSMGKGNAKIASLMNSDNNMKQASKIRSTAETECENPSESELKRQLALGYLKHIEKIIDGVEYIPSEQFKLELQARDTSDAIYRSTYEDQFGSRQCARSTQTQWARHGGPGVCPYHFENKFRHNWYPFRVRHAVCNCQDSCLRHPNMANATRHTHACLPNHVVKLALERKGCQSDGVYAFEPAFEYVPISCSCREKKSVKFN